MILQALVKYYEMICGGQASKTRLLHRESLLCAGTLWGGGALRHHDPKATR